MRWPVVLAALLLAPGTIAQSSEYHLRPGEFPPRGSEHVAAGELVNADFIHRRGTFRATGTGALVDFKLLPCGVVTVAGASGDLRDVPAGAAVHLSLFADETGAFTLAAAITADAPPISPQTTAEQHKRHAAFIKDRGLPALIEGVEGKQMTVTLLGEADDVRAMLKAEGIDPDQWATQHKRVRAVVANPELRTYNPGVDGEDSTILEYKAVPTDRFGCSGVCWVLRPNLLLEGFRKRRYVRLFVPGWRVHDMAFGEGLYTEVPDAKVEEESPNQYPFRTDFGNADLPWYQLKAGEFPPHGSQHMVPGELVKADASGRAGQLRVDLSGEVIDFTLPPVGGVLYHNAEAELGDVPLGTHCYFSMYQDAKGAFTRAGQVADDFTNTLADRVTYRVDAANPARGTLVLARHLGVMNDELEHPVQPPDLARGLFEVDDKTRIWKNDATAKFSDLAVGDDLVFNRTGRTATSLGRCTELWVGAPTQKKAAGEQRAKHAAWLREQGVPAWVESVEGKKVTVTFFTASRKDFPAVLDSDPWGKSVQVVLADDQLRPQGPAVKTGFASHLPGGNTVGSLGCSGVRWVLEWPQLPATLKPGQVVRVWKEGWPVKVAQTKVGS